MSLQLIKMSVKTATEIHKIRSAVYNAMNDDESDEAWKISELCDKYASKVREIQDKTGFLGRCSRCKTPLTVERYNLETEELVMDCYDSYCYDRMCEEHREETHDV